MFVALCSFCALWAQKPVVSKAAAFAITPPVRSFGIAKPEPGKTFKNEKDEDEVNEENGEIIKEIISEVP